MRARHNIFLECMRLARDVGVRFAVPVRSVELQEHDATADAAARPAAPTRAELRRVVESYGPEGDHARPAGPTISGGFLPTVAKP